MEDLAGGWLGQNVCLFGGCYNHFIPHEEFCEMIQSLPWRCLSDVRLLFWDEEDETFTTIEFPMKRPKGRKRKPS